MSFNLWDLEKILFKNTFYGTPNIKIIKGVDVFSAFDYFPLWICTISKIPLISDSKNEELVNEGRVFFYNWQP